MKRIEIDDALVEAVFTEKDEFRLAVRGMTLMEAVLEQAIDDAFAGGMPKALEGLNRPSLVALAKALELIDEDLEKALLALGAIRNEFAHEIVDEVTEEQIKGLASVIQLGPNFDWKKDSAGDLFRASMYVTWNSLLDTIAHAEDQRDRAASELAAFRSARSNDNRTSWGGASLFPGDVEARRATPS